MCLPFVILVGLQTGVSILEGLVFLSPIALVSGLIQVYFFIVLYSHFKLLTYDGEQAAYQAHQTANSAGYEKFYESEGFNPQDHPMESGGYQTTEFQGN